MEEYWDRFVASGKIEDYLYYKGMSQVIAKLAMLVHTLEFKQGRIRAEHEF